LQIIPLEFAYFLQFVTFCSKPTQSTYSAAVEKPNRMCQLRRQLCALTERLLDWWRGIPNPSQKQRCRSILSYTLPQCPLDAHFAMPEPVLPVAPPLYSRSASVRLYYLQQQSQQQYPQNELFVSNLFLYAHKSS